MKRVFAWIVVLSLVFGLVGCSNAPEEKLFLLQDGRYVLTNAKDMFTVPYIHIRDGEFGVTIDMAVSYQPGGKIARNGNEVVMATRYGNGEFRWTFRLINDNTLKLVPYKSSNIDFWTWLRGMEFVLDE
ncbi:MAG: hypothetical protein E7435_05985 [Ruminococcaceae bacterium]|nr:hypothetical protein [Oscillospiraceae bacterium]